MPTVPKEEETGNDAFMVSYYKYDKVKLSEAVSAEPLWLRSPRLY